MKQQSQGRGADSNPQVPDRLDHPKEWFTYVIADWLTETGWLSPAALGACTRLAAYSWLHGPIEITETTLRKVGGSGPEVLEDVRDAWEEGPEGWTFPPLERARDNALGRRGKKRGAGQMGGLAKASGAKQDVAEPSGATHKEREREKKDREERQTETEPVSVSKKRRDGKAELLEAYNALPRAMWVGDLLPACEEYRKERVERKFPLLPAKKWAAYFEQAKGDPVCAAEAFREATLGGWRSVHPKPTQGSTGAPRPTPAMQRKAESQAMLERIINGAPKTIQAEGRAL